MKSNDALTKEKIRERKAVPPFLKFLFIHLACYL